MTFVPTKPARPTTPDEERLSFRLLDGGRAHAEAIKPTDPLLALEIETALGRVRQIDLLALWAVFQRLSAEGRP